MVTLLPADYAVVGATGVLAVLGLFGGLSGALAFLAGSVAAVSVGRLGWGFSAAYLASPYARGAAVAVAALLAFGLIRWIVRKCVHGLLAQPADALFGSVVSAATGAVLALLAVWGINAAELAEAPSNLLTLVRGALA